MEKSNRFQIIATVLSIAYLAAAIGLLVWLCKACELQLGERLRTAITGLDSGPIRAAFETLADGLERGQPVREVFSATGKLLFPPCG